MALKAKRDYYEVLGVSKTADEAAIKRAYRKLAKKYHPDSNKENKKAEEAFKEVTEAYGILSDKEKRKLYDQYGHAAFDENFAGGYGSRGGQSGFDGFGGFGGFGNGTWTGGNGNYQRHAGPNGYREFHFDGNDEGMEDILKNIFGGFGGSFSHSGPRRKKGSHVHADIDVSFDEAAFGGKRKITLEERGGLPRTYEVNIPAGIAEGQKIRLKGKGNPGAGGGENGDLMLKVHIKDKPGYIRKGQDVYTTVSIPFTTAVFGGEATIQTIYGNVVCKIKPGTQSDTKIRLRGKGIVSMNHPETHGDQYTTVQIQVPKDLNFEEKQKLKDFADTYNKNRHGHSNGRSNGNAA